VLRSLRASTRCSIPTKLPGRSERPHPACRLRGSRAMAINQAASSCINRLVRQHEGELGRGTGVVSAPCGDPGEPQGAGHQPGGGLPRSARRIASPTEPRKLVGFEPCRSPRESSGGAPGL
jgi:hypothetical protein